MRRRSFVTGICTLALVLAAQAGRSAELDRVWTLLFAVDRYEDERVPAPPDAARRAAEIAEVLADPEIFPGGAERTFLLADLSIPRAVAPTANHLRDAFNQIARRSQPGDTLLFILLASGAPTADEFRWFAADADPNRLSETSLLSSEIHEWIDATRCSRVVSIIDATFNLSGVAPVDGHKITPSGWLFAFVALEGEGRTVLASTDGRADSVQDWEARSKTFFEAVQRGLRGEADRDGGQPDGWIDAAELASFVREADPESWTTGRAPRAWIARHPAADREAAARIQRLTEKKEQGQIDDRTLSTGVRLLSRMPPWEDDRKLRRAFIDFLNGDCSIDELEAARRRSLTRRNLPETQAQAFAGKVQEAWTLIAQHHLDADRAPAALRAGLNALADEFGDSSAQLRDDVARIAELRPPDLAAELARFRLRLGRRDGVDDQRAAEVCLSAMLESLDPYSAYLPPAVFRQILERNTGKFTGVGALLRADPANKSILVLAPVRGGPAEEAGLKPGDRIVEVDGQAVASLGEGDASERLLGPEGTSVRLLVQRAENQKVELTVQRRTVDVENIVGFRRNAEGEWDYWADPERRIAYVRIASFAADTASRLRKILVDLQSNGMRGLVVDLRFNPGGLLESAVAVSDLFLSGGPIVAVKGRKGKDQTFSANRFGSLDQVPLCVLVNQWSASGSEIFAAAIQDNGRGAVVGSRTFGKASVQDVIPTGDEQAALKVTSARFFRPNGDNLERYLGGRLLATDAWGVRPDPGLEAPLYREDALKLQVDLLRRQVLDDPAPQNVDPQLERAIQHLVSKLDKPATKS
jgi:carboxyl-terminal processing protease